VLAIMGSGETSPTMVKVHRGLVEQPAVLLDTPFGFQENADDIAARAVEYFRESVGAAVDVVSLRSASVADDDPVAYESALARLRAARFVFAGPGSPTYALRTWRSSGVPAVLRDKLRAGGSGGVVVFASAAALTLGVLTVPVYEVYKVGADPEWVEGLDLLSEAGLRVAVIPHYNNAEGGNHDTRYCYLGERRLRLLEESLPADAFVLGVDEHTGLVLDLDAGTASVVGLGTVTARVQGRSTVFESGAVVPIDALRPGSSGAVAAPVASAPSEAAPAASLLDTVAECEAAFDQALAAGDGPGAVRAVLAVEQALVEWSRDTLQSDEADRARAVLRGMIVRLAEAHPPVGPFVEALLDLRAAARADRRWADADAVRDALVALGVEVSDTPEGSTWRLLS
jgi:hypothetical protein